jgi:hypothetical protein
MLGLIRVMVSAKPAVDGVAKTPRSTPSNREGKDIGRVRIMYFGSR